MPATDEIEVARPVARWTAGPWVFVDAEQRAAECYTKQCIIRGGGKQIAAFSWQTPSKAFPSREESKANARLIAAAPEMADSISGLLGLLQLIHDRDDVSESLRDVLKSNHRVVSAEAILAKIGGAA